jgi:hypothetical protein
MGGSPAGRRFDIRVPFPWLAAVAAIPVVAAVACGGSAPAQVVEATAATSAGATEAVPSAITRPASSFTVDALVAAGWKRSKELDASLLPGSTGAWYGFFDRSDIEVRVYPDHQTATGAGVAAALEALGRSPNSNIRGGVITSLGNRTQYHAYVVAGNLVLLCEKDTDACLRLIQQVP